jgi:AraC-like DNA-binding protein
MQVILIFCTLAIGHSLFAASALFMINRKLSNRLLATLLLLLAIRIGKSVVQMMLKPEMSYTTSVVGVMSMAAIGPILLFLIKSLFRSDYRIKPVDLLHFLPLAILPITLFVQDWRLLGPAYYLITAHLFIYILLTYAYIIKNRDIFRSDNLRWTWSLLIIGSVSILSGSFLLQITNYYPIVYAVNVVSAAFIFYGLSLWTISRSKLFLPEAAVKPEHAHVLDELGKRIKENLESGLYLDPALTISSVAATLKTQPYLVSKAVNHCYKKSFSEVVTQYRIQKAESLLMTDVSKRYTIEGIAFESGFNTLSAFYTSFKKIHHKTPAQYRDDKLKSKQRSTALP